MGGGIIIWEEGRVTCEEGMRGPNKGYPDMVRTIYPSHPVSY